MKFEYKLLKDKKGFLLRDFVIVGILFGGVIALYLLMVADVANNYNNNDIIDEDFAQHYSQLSTNLAQLDSSYSTVKGSSGLNFVGSFDVAFNSVFTVIVMVWDGITIYSGMASSLSGDFSFLDSGVMLILMGTIIAILVVYLIFIWLSSVSRGKL